MQKTTITNNPAHEDDHLFIMSLFDMSFYTDTPESTLRAKLKKLQIPANNKMYPIKIATDDDRVINCYTQKTGKTWIFVL